MVGGSAFTKEQAKKIAQIIGTADGSCFVCVGLLCDQMAEAFPGYEWHRMAGLGDEA